MKTAWLSACACAALLVAAPAAFAADPPAGRDLSKAPRMGTWGFDLAGRNLATTPGQDFFEYANGTYLKTLEIPADRTNWGAFAMLNEPSQSRLHAVVEKAAVPGRSGKKEKAAPTSNAAAAIAAVEGEVAAAAENAENQSAQE